MHFCDPALLVQHVSISEGAEPKCGDTSSEVYWPPTLTRILDGGLRVRKRRGQDHRGNRDAESSHRNGAEDRTFHFSPYLGVPAEALLVGE
jgi:hypothetical protein